MRSTSSCDVFNPSREMVVFVATTPSTFFLQNDVHDVVELAIGQVWGNLQKHRAMSSMRSVS